MFNIEIDKVLLEIGINKSELYTPEDYKIVVISNQDNVEEIDTIIKEVLDKYYPDYDVKVILNEHMSKDEVRLSLTPKSIIESVYVPCVPCVELSCVRDLYKGFMSLLEPKTNAKFNIKSK